MISQDREIFTGGPVTTAEKNEDKGPKPEDGDLYHGPVQQKKYKTLSDILGELKGLSESSSGEKKGKCKVCGSEIKPDSDRCHICGTVFKVPSPTPTNKGTGTPSLEFEKCPACGEQVDEGFIICPKCGIVREPEPVPLSLVVPVDTYTTSETDGSKERDVQTVGVVMAPEPEMMAELITEPQGPPMAVLISEPGPEPDLVPEAPAIEGQEPSTTPPDDEDVVDMVSLIAPSVPQPEVVASSPEPAPEVVLETPLAAQPEGSLTNGKEVPAAPVVRMRTVKTSSKAERAKAERRLLNGSGLIEARGLVNGNGLVNGRGLVNGNGLVNGRGRPLEEQKGASSTRVRGRRKKSKVWIVGVLFVVLSLLALPVLYIFLGPDNEQGMTVDGDFSDWKNAMTYVDGNDTTVPWPDLDIVSYGATVDEGNLFLRIEVRGDLLSGKVSSSGVDVVHVFFDTDGSEATGFDLGGFGADYYAEVYGYNGVIKGSALLEFPNYADRLDWNGWESAGGVSAIVKGGAMEMSVQATDISAGFLGGPRILFQVADTHSLEGDFSKAVLRPGEAALVVEQKDIAGEVLASPSQGSAVIQLGMDAKGGPVTISQLTLNRTGNATDRDTGAISLSKDGTVLSSGVLKDGTVTLVLAPEVTIEPGSSAIIRVLADVPSNVEGASFGLSLGTKDAVTVGNGTVTLHGNKATSLSYLGAPPKTIVIDGAFGDWSNVAKNIDKKGDASTKGLDITDYRDLKEDSTVSFYASVDGTMLAGASTPMVEVPRVPPPAGPATPLPVRKGADSIKVLIDVDKLAITGCPVQGMTFGADLALVAQGIEGRILSTDIFSWSATKGTWARSGTFKAANDRSRIEMQVPLSDLGIDNKTSFRVFFQTADWSGKGDLSDSSLEIIDPLILTSDGNVNSSSDGNTWKHETDIGTKTFADMAVNWHNGTAYALATDGTVYQSTGDWTKWTKIINSTVDTNFVALATDSKGSIYFYGLQADGDVFNTTNSSWQHASDIDKMTDYTDMCYVTGSGKSATILVIRASTADKVKRSTDGGFTFADIGKKNIGVDAGDTSIVNVGIVNTTDWGYGYNFVLQSDGDVRYDKSDSANMPWPRLTTPATGNYADITNDSSGKLWIVTTQGQVYKFTPSAGEGNGNWSTLGNASTTNVVAIAVGEIPEFKDVLIPIISTVAVVIFLRRGRSRRVRQDE